MRARLSAAIMRPVRKLERVPLLMSEFGKHIFQLDIASFCLKLDVFCKGYRIIQILGRHFVYPHKTYAIAMISS